MRWILTWKLRDDGTSKPKARAVILGYRDTSYEHRATTSPVLNRQTRRFLMQVAANHGWSVYNGDVSGAFLPLRPYLGNLFCIPCPEICESNEHTSRNGDKDEESVLQGSGRSIGVVSDGVRVSCWARI